MLIGIDPLLSPPLLLLALAEMGHGDAIAIVDANFPAASVHPRVIRLAGADAVAVLRAVLTVLPIDTFIPCPVSVMQVVGRSTRGNYAILGKRSSNRHQTKSACNPRQCLFSGSAWVI